MDSVGGVTCEKYFKVLEIDLARRPAFSSPYYRNPPRRSSRAEGSYLDTPTPTLTVFFTACLVEECLVIVTLDTDLPDSISAFVELISERMIDYRKATLP